MYWFSFCSSLYHRTLLMEHLSLFFTKNVNNINQRITYVSLQALSVVVRQWSQQQWRKHVTYIEERLILLDRNSHGRFHARPPKAFVLLWYTKIISCLNTIHLLFKSIKIDTPHYYTIFKDFNQNRDNVIPRNNILWLQKENLRLFLSKKSSLLNNDNICSVHWVHYDGMVLKRSLSVT